MKQRDPAGWTKSHKKGYNTKLSRDHHVDCGGMINWITDLQPCSCLGKWETLWFSGSLVPVLPVTWKALGWETEGCQHPPLFSCLPEMQWPKGFPFHGKMWKFRFHSNLKWNQILQYQNPPQNEITFHSTALLIDADCMQLRRAC